MKYILSAFADEYSDSLTEQCSALNNFGIGYMEIRGVNGKNISLLTPQEVKQVKQVLNDFGIKVSSVGSPVGKINLAGDLNAHLDMSKRVFETANELGAGYVRGFSFYLPEGKTRRECRTQVLFELERILNEANRSGIKYCHENEALIYGEGPDECKDLLDYFGGRLRCVFDMGNFVLDGYDPMAAYNKLAKYIEYFHIKDSLYAGAIVPAGKGEARIKDILSEHKKTASDTFISLEPHLQTFSGLNQLAAKSFDNPYKFPDQKTAFTSAVEHLKTLLQF